MARTLVVEGEPSVRVADRDDPRVEPAKASLPARGRAQRFRRGRQIWRAQRLRPEHVLDVGEDQLLMLLLVVQPEHDRRDRSGRDGAVTPGRHQAFHRGIDAAAVVLDLGERRARELSAARALHPRAHPFVVRVEEEPVTRVDRPVAGGEGSQHEGLEEPGRVREVPLGGAGVGHRLHQLVLAGERRRQGHRAGADGRVVVEEAHEDRGGPKGSARLVSPSCSRPWSAPPRPFPS